MHPVTLIAEACCNHGGNLPTAFEMIEEASRCGADVIKFQKRNLLDPRYHKYTEQPHPNPQHSFGSTYWEHRSKLEFPLEDHKLLQNYCHQNNIEYSCSVWDPQSALDIISLNPPFIKVPSALNTDTELLTTLIDNYQKPIHVSTGMVTNEEILSIVKLFKQHKRLNDLVLYACTSAYPASHDDIYLLDIHKLKKYTGQAGFSGHHRGIALDIAAYVTGASFIERHFTLDRAAKGTDHAASLEPQGLSKLSRDLDAVRTAMNIKKSLSDAERAQRAKLKGM